MDQGENHDEDISMQHGDSNYNLYDTYGSDMVDEVNVVDATAFPLDSWHPGHQYHPDVITTTTTTNTLPHHQYDPHNTNMEDITTTTSFSHDFHDPQQFNGGFTIGEEAAATLGGGDQHGDQMFDLNAMDIYQHPLTTSIYPNLTQEHGNYVDHLTPSTVSGTITNPSDHPQPTESNIKSSSSLTTGSSARTNFKFSADQKKLLLEKFNSGTHYPSNAEKEQFAEMFGTTAESISRWFERTRKEKGVQRTKRVPTQETKPQMPQYLPVQQQLPQQPQTQPQQLQPTPSQPPPNLMQQYPQFPSTYPYNTLNPQVFAAQQFNQTQAQPAQINPTSAMYAPIPFVGQSQPIMHQPIPPAPSASPRPSFAVEIPSKSINRQGLYIDDTRDIKRPKLAPAPIAPAPAPIAPKPAIQKKPMSFEQEVLTVLRPSEWREDPTQAAEDLYELMTDAEDNTSQKLFLLRSIRTNATEAALKAYLSFVDEVNDRITSEENRRILAKIRNWFTAGIKANDKGLLSVILEVVKRMNLDGRTMAGIKLGKPLILLLKKDEPTLKAQLTSLQKTAYEAYALEKDSGVKPIKSESPVTTEPAKPTAPPPIAPKPAPETSASVSAMKPASRPAISADKAYSNLASKIKVTKQPSSGSSFFGKLAQTPAIPKTPVLQKPIPLKKSTTTPSQSMGVSAGTAKASNSATTKPPPKPITPSAPAKPAPAPSKFSVLEYINRGDTSDQSTKSEESTKPAAIKKLKRVSWATEGQLEQVKMIENITIKYADDLFWHPPQAIESARDLDIGEGHAFGKDLVEYDVEEEIEWYEPKPFDFSTLLEKEERGIKRAGTKTPEAKDAKVQKVREAGVLLVTYLSDGDIPGSPSEPFLEELVSSQQIVPPKIIPLPQDLRNPASGGAGSGGIVSGIAQQPVAAPAIANPDVNAWLNQWRATTGQPTYQTPAAAPTVQPPDLDSILRSLTGQTAPAPSPTLDLNALLAQINPQPVQQQPPPPPPQQRWTSPPPAGRPHQNDRDTIRKGKKRDAESRIKASRSDDIRESVRNSRAEPNMYRALCQFYKTGGCKVGEGCTFVHPRDMSMYDQ